MIFSHNEYKQKLITPLFFIFIGIFTSCTAQKNFIQRVDPPNWWTDMEMDTIELLIEKNTTEKLIFSSKSKAIQILSQTEAKNTLYTYLTIAIQQNGAEENAEINFTGPTKKLNGSFVFPIHKRRGKFPLEVTAADNMYLLFPDRFANGDPTNDSKEGMLEKADRNELKGRHGGDLAGVEQHLDFIEKMGMTALWLNPILENNQPKESYHGYAATDSYKVDPRLGTNEQFVKLVKTCQDRGIKMVWDVVYNHWGNQHHLFKNLPDSNWVHWFDSFTRTNYRSEVLMDPNASALDKKIMTDGWFDTHMPDLNQQDEHLAKYLIQNSIWWVEYAGLDAFRIDTYPYPDQKFMAQLNQSLKREYPTLLIFGETWVQGSPVQAWFTKGQRLNQGFDSYLDGVTDFQWYFSVTKGLNEGFGWEEGLRRIEMNFAHDYLYENVNQNVTFLDNHDLGRFYSIIGEDFQKWKIGMSLLATSRGIPCLYYGNEILMTGFTNPDAHVRKDFPGGWAGDPLNLFNPDNMSKQQREAFDYTTQLFQWRKQNPWIGNARTLQFVPDENTYVYFRINESNKIMCLYNTDEKDKTISLLRFNEALGGSTSGMNILTREKIPLVETITIPAKSSLLIQVYP